MRVKRKKERKLVNKSKKEKRTSGKEKRRKNIHTKTSKSRASTSSAEKWHFINKRNSWLINPAYYRIY